MINTNKYNQNKTVKDFVQYCFAIMLIVSAFHQVCEGRTSQQNSSKSIDTLQKNLNEILQKPYSGDTLQETFKIIDSLIEQKVDVANLLVQECKDNTVSRNMIIFNSLSYVGTERAKDALLEIALDTKYTDSYLLGDTAANSYISLAKDSTEIAQLLKSKQSRVIDAALEGLRTTTLTRPAVEALGQILNSTSSWRHHVVSSAFGWDTSSENAARKIELLLSNLANLENLEDKEKIKPGMGLSGYEFAYGSYISAMELMPGANNILLERLDSANEQQRKLIIIALGRRREPAIREKLLQMIMTEKDGFLRWQAVTAFFNIANEQDIPLLNELAANDPYIRKRVVSDVVRPGIVESPDYYPVREEAKTLLEWLPTRPPQNDEELADYGRLAEMETLDLRKSRVTDSGLAHLVKLTNLKELWLEDCFITDAGMVHITSLKNLESLRLNNTNITDEGLVNISSLVNLTELGLDNTDISDAALNHISKLKNLTNLELEGTRISDRGLVNLKKMNSLQVIRLGNSFVTEAGLDELKNLNNLNRLILKGKGVNDNWLERVKELKSINWLGLNGTRVTDAGLTDLKKTLPDMTIQRY